MKSTAAALIAAKNALESGDSWLWLLKVVLDASNTLYLARSTERVTFNGQAYEAFPFSIGEIKEDSEGNLTSLDLAVRDFAGEIRQVLEDYDLDDAAVTLTLVHSANLADGAAKVEETFTVKGWRGGLGQITFTLGHSSLLRLPCPGRQLLRNRCAWVYMDAATCGYAGTLPTCDRTLEGADGCRVHANVARFGGGPTMPYGRMPV